MSTSLPGRLEPDRDRRARVDPVFEDRPTSDSMSETMALRSGAEMSRLVRARLQGMVIMWLLALAWSRVQPVNVPLLNFAAAAGITINVLSLVLLRRAAPPRWLGRIQVVGDLAITPAFLTATGGPMSPFNAVVIARSAGVAMIVGRRNGIFYACGILAVSWLWWALAGDNLAIDTLAALALVGLTIVVLQAADYPLRIYRERRKLLVSENRRLEEAIAELETQNRRLTALHTLSQDIGSLGELPEVAKRLRDALLRSFPGVLPSFLLYRRDSALFEPVLLADGADLARLAPLTAAFTAALSRPPEYAPAGERLDPRAASQLRVPLLLGEKPVGLLLLESATPSPLREEDRALLATMANEIAVAVRNADLHARAVGLQREVIQAEKLASLGQFVAGVAHEMNNPLTAITAYGTFLRDAAAKGKEAPDAASKLAEIVQAGERIQRFVQSLLGFSRPSKGTAHALSLNDAVSAAVQLCQYDLKIANVEVKSLLAADLPAIDGVEGELQQVFINLFTNAAHAMAPEGGSLTVTTALSADSVRATVADTGRGIEPDALGKIWEPFYTTKAEGAGTGLGLSIVKKIVEQHRGTISVESAPGKGTTFTLVFPA